VPLKLEQEWASVWLKARFTIRCEHEFVEEVGIEEPWVQLTRSQSIAWLFRITGDGDLFPYLEAHLEVFGDLAQIAPKLVGCRRSIERRVVANGPEEWLVLVLVLAILAEAFPGKRALGILLEIDLALPAFVRPGRSAEANEW
jgi:hypothetical protein